MSRAGQFIYLRQQLFLGAVPGLEFQPPGMAGYNCRSVSAQPVMLPTQRQHEHVAHAPAVLQNVMNLSRHIPLMRSPADDTAQRLHGLHVGALSLGQILSARRLLLWVLQASIFANAASLTNR
jgi:hypothetical protein